MENKPLISFVVPVYNVEKYLEECVNSLINQTYKNIEIILVDDGSPDNCPKICDDYAKQDNRIKVIHKSNGGVSEARLFGVQNAVGRYVVCVDADDTVTADINENLVKIITEYSPDIVCYNYNLTDENNNIIKVQPNKFDGLYTGERLEQIYHCLVKGNDGSQFPPSIWSKAVKRDIILTCMQLMDNRIKIGEDMCLCATCILKSHSIYFANKPLYNYRTNPQSVTKNKKAFPWEDVEYKAEYLKKVLPQEKYDFHGQICRCVVHSLFNVACSVVSAKADKKQAKIEIREKLSNPLYAEYIKNCKFTSWKEKFGLYCVKHKKIGLMKLYLKVFNK